MSGQLLIAPREVAPVEPYVDAGRLAEAMGVSTRTIKRWTAEGMPSETWGQRTRRYRLSECIAWARAREASRVSADETKPARRMTTASAPTSQGVDPHA
jgi:phage terminase Nu1 subunit (DNA packaging protein)